MNNDLIHINTLPPFKRMCVSIGNLPTSFMESMTYYEALEWLYRYLSDTVIPTINNTGEAVTELQTAFLTLKDYVDNYFENLDVQEEINNKLDEMAESGELTDIIAQYLGLAGVLSFDNVSSMKLAANLVNGSTAHTLGYYSVNDGGESFYKIRTITNDDVVDEEFIIALNDNTLIAELIYNDEINLLQLGAKKDNSTDAGAIITKCINKTDIHKIYIPYGTYKVTQSITIKDDLNIKGDNAVINYTGLGSMLITPDSPTQTLRFYMSNLTINGDETNNCINFNLLIDSRLENLLIYHFYNAVTMSNSWDDIFVNIRIQSSANIPLNLGNQFNNSKFLNCYIVSQNKPITMTNCEGVSFDTCDISNNLNEVGISVFQCLVEFNNCYFENLNPSKTIIVSTNETKISVIKINNCMVSSDGISVYPAKASLEFTNSFKGNITITDRYNSTGYKPAVDYSLNNLIMPLNYYASKESAAYYFDGKENPNFATIGNDPDKTVVFQNGSLTVTFPNNTSTLLGGLAFSNLEIGKHYLLFLDGVTPSDTSLYCFQYGETYSSTINLNTHNNSLIIPFTAHATNFYIRWSFTGSVVIRKLIIQEAKNYIS